jgi:F-type H+-transporting ATPase subunit b
MELLLPDFGLLFWMLLAFGIVFVVLSKYGFPVITKMVEDRRKYIEQSLKEAGEAHAALVAIKADSEKILAEAGQQRIQILKESRVAGDKIIADAKQEAAVQVQKQLEESRVALLHEKEEALRAVRSEIALLSIEIAEKVTRASLAKDAAQVQLINNLLDEVNTSQVQHPKGEA